MKEIGIDMVIARLRRALAYRQRGQMLIIFALLIVPVSLVIGVVAVDASMWQSERRGAQKDADLAALAGAIQLLDPAASAGDAIGAADQYRTTNDEAGNSTPIAATAGIDCNGASGARPSHVKVDLKHKTRLFFGDAFGLSVPEPGAHACARAGSVTGTSGIVPFEIDAQTAPCYVSGKPQFGTLCGLEFGSNNGPGPKFNPRGLLDLEAPDGHCSDANASGDPEDLIENGAPGHCMINTASSCDPAKNGPWDDCVGVQTGNPKKVLDGVQARIAREGACDTTGDGIESFGEVVRLVYDNADLSKRIYESIDCDPNADGTQVSPRLITIIVLDGPPSAGNDGYPIVGFAGFYLAGCSSAEGLTSDGDLSFDEKKCDVKGAQAAPVFSNGGRLASPPQAPDAHHKCGHTSSPPCTPAPTNTPFGNTATPTNTPGGPVPTATPTGPGGGNNPGHSIVYGDFVNLVTTNGDIGDFDPKTTLVGVALTE